LFLAVYLFSATEAYQLLKLPVVFQHFKEHKKEDKNISFLQFLAMHYLHGSPKDKDYERDMQLPFKTSGEYLSSVSPDFVPAVLTIPITKTVEAPEKRKLSLQVLYLQSPCLSAIWQPPKSC
jgi:hypothetical protein